MKQTHDVKLAESFSPITKKLDDVSKSTRESLLPLNEKLNTINESTKKLGDLIKESNSENNKETIVPTSILLQDTSKYLSETPSSIKLNQDKGGNLSILGAPIKSLGGDKIQVYDNIYEFNPEIYKALSNSSYTGESMKNENGKRNLYNFLVDIGYNGQGDEKTNQKKFFTSLFKFFGNIKKEEPDNLKGRGIVNIIIPSSNIDIDTRLETLLGLKLSGHTDTLTEASNLFDELYKLGEIQNKQQY